MEEIREAAIAYYNNLSHDLKCKAYNMFLAMDSNGDDKISMDEYMQNFSQLGLKLNANPRFFMELDRNGDGILDFEEFLSLYYLIRSGRFVFCDGHGCGAFLKGLYFTCSDCFSISQNTFDLCSSCFNTRNYYHHHDTIFDNFTLFRCMAGYRTRVAQAQTQWQTQTYHQVQPAGPSQMGQCSTTQGSISALSAPGGSSRSASGTIKEVTEVVGDIKQLVNFAQNIIDICSIM
ncbi:uncharacterized protein LOC107435394 [Ziziphus jujuba]|uniref:Uncharacterized protein LOC107435394 n=2 Tax=Ziziphus jujuba TaxID=326968 RepID=A0ABM3IRE3_ZIZJJ|nr:uncharacterized protein LOC107435394 [Ziziphus jujuba]KAH7521990.1 hypothetical protein FEM48_Zijuj07G0090400 [Ziziphus jujuba var. spinosa]